jgi:ketosteroid isomerase-like protein
MMRTRGFLFLALVAACVGCGSQPGADTRVQDQADIQALEGRFTTAFNAKDVNAVMALYTPGDNLIVFDAVPPRQFTGWPAYKKDWEGFFAAFPGPAVMAMSDLDVTVGGDVAYGHNIEHVTMTDKTGKKVEITVRVTDGYTKVNGQWLISHEHVSVPVDFDTMKPDLDSK